MAIDCVNLETSILDSVARQHLGEKLDQFYTIAMG